MIAAGYYCFTLDICPSFLHPSVRFSFSDDNWSKQQWIFTKLSMCIDIVEIWFGIAMSKFRKFFTELSTCSTIMAGYYDLTVLFLFIKYLPLSK